MALHSLYCADVPLRNCSLTHDLSFMRSDIDKSSVVLLYVTFGFQCHQRRATHRVTVCFEKWHKSVSFCHRHIVIISDGTTFLNLAALRQQVTSLQYSWRLGESELCMLISIEASKLLNCFSYSERSVATKKLLTHSLHWGTQTDFTHCSCCTSGQIVETSIILPINAPFAH